MQAVTADKFNGQPVLQKKVYRESSLLIIFGVTLMAVMGASSVTPAFPKMVQILHISSQKIGLLMTAFTFPGILLTPVLGVLADQFGRKKVLFPSLLLFGVAGAACAFTRNFHLLLLLRLLQGVGGASLNSLNVTLIGDIFTGQRRAQAMGYNASVLSLGIAVYPAIGGALTMLGWNYPFLLSIVALPIAFAVLFFLDNPEPKGEQPKLSTYFGNILRSVQDRKVFGLFVASVMTFTILYGPFFTYLPFLIEKRFGVTPLASGFIISTMSLAMCITSLQLGRLRRRFSEKSLILISFTLYGLGMLLIPFAPTVQTLLIPIIIFGIGHGINIPSIHTLLADLAPMEFRAAFVSINNGLVFRLGQTLGPLAMGYIFSSVGVSATFWVSSGLALLTILTVYWMIKS